MNFRTPVSLPPTALRLAPTARVVALGSCFAAHIGQRLADSLPEGAVTVNPFGTLYNPQSIAQSWRALAGEAFDPARTFRFEAEDRWHCWDCDTRLTAPTRDALLRLLAERQAACRENYERADALLLTFSTDHVYRLLSDGRPVANCHKQPQRLFREEVMPADEVFEEYERLIARFFAERPAAHIVLTLSPYRYAKYGMHGNALAKARLLLFIERLCALDERVVYFPAYEIVCDELRDYRFYAPDMLHPSQQAVDYVWERFREWAFTPELEAFARQREAELRRQRHVPLQS